VHLPPIGASSSLPAASRLCRYNLDIWITENGVSVPKEASLTPKQALDDQFRIGYFSTYLDKVCKAVK
jgi:beta-glucosidase/6-phospho-beta-glucosidase/beta-galactosidase